MVRSQGAEDSGGHPLPGGTNAAGLPGGSRAPGQVVVVRTATILRLVRYCNYPVHICCVYSTGVHTFFGYMYSESLGLVNLCSRIINPCCANYDCTVGEGGDGAPPSSRIDYGSIPFREWLTSICGGVLYKLSTVHANIDYIFKCK